jgi:aminoglycoside phosphotransferase (APT) family kinase protein
VYWTEPGDPYPALPDAPTLLGGFPSRDELVEAYAAASGRDVTGVDYYVAFGYWKLACILEGVCARYKEGVMAGNDDELWKLFAAQVELLAQAAEAAVARLP